jgi:Integrase core domain
MPAAGPRPRFLLRDCDTSFTRAFDDGFGSEGAEVLITPVQAPNANAYAERWIRTVRVECLDWLLIGGRGHLEHVLRVYVDHDDVHRPHRALGLEPPDPSADPTVISGNRRRVHRRDRLGGVLHEYYRQAARTSFCTLRDPLRVLSVDLPARARRLPVPWAFLQRGTEYKVEVLAIEAGGNQTLTEIAFTVK